MMPSSSALFVVVALLKPSAPAQSAFRPPTDCGPVAVFPVHGIPEAEGRSADLSVWALVFNPLEAHSDIKIVWNVTGTGAFRVRG